MSVINSAVIVGLCTLLSRIFGFIRECVMYATLGASMYADCFVTALKLASVCRRIFAEGALNSSFLPRFTSVLVKGGKIDGSELLSKIFSLLTVVLVCMSAFVIVNYDAILGVLAAGFKSNPTKFTLTISLGRIMFPFILFVSITALFCSAANSLKSFALPAIVHSTVNIFSIITIVACAAFRQSTYVTIHMLAISIVVSGAIQVIIMWVYLVRKHGIIIKFTLNVFSPAVKDVLKNMIPGVVSAGVWQINLLVDTLIGSYLPSGTISCLSVADRLNQLPLATLGTAIGTAMLPALSSAVAEKNEYMVSSELRNGISFAMLLALPAFVVLFTLSEPIVAVAFQRGAFCGEFVKITASALQAFSIGLPAYILTKILSSIFFAYKDTKTPTIYAIIAVSSNILCLFLLVPFGKHYGVALSTAISAIVNATVLWYGAKKRHNIILTKDFRKKILLNILATVGMFVYLYALQENTWSPEYGESAVKYLYLFCVSLSGVFLYVSAVYILSAIVSRKILNIHQLKNYWLGN